MCQDCGCDEANHHHHHEHTHHHQDSRKIEVEESVLAKNDHIAHHNQHFFANKNILAINLMSSPGTGKTALLEKTLQKLSANQKIAVLVGDQQTDNDAKRLSGKGAWVKQINTHSSCHLDALMIEKELPELPAETQVLLIENVGNLVCPAAFNLGEHKKIALLSTTEGEDKPLKYPTMFNRADLVIITKSDLAPHVDWNQNLAEENIRKVNPSAQIITCSAKTGEGLDSWCNWLYAQQKTQKAA